MLEDHIIHLEEIHKSYFLSNGVEMPILKGLDLKVKKGEFLIIMGESGGGKSTLLNILGCLHPLTSGKYHIKGEDIGIVRDDYTLAFIRNKLIGFVFQQFNLLSKLTALKNVALPALYAGEAKIEREEKAAKILTSVGLGDRLHHKPTELSGGQQQRVAIARALVNEPEIILADEPTGALDTESGKEIMKIFVDLNKKGKTIIMVTHEPSIATYGHRIIFLRDGQIIDHNYKLPNL
jgi:putative ABC transport system ATP-binding protein